jgi:hypothetical protein
LKKDEGNSSKVIPLLPDTISEFTSIEAPTSLEELEKKSKGIRKRLKQIEVLKESRDSGFAMNEDQVNMHPTLFRL